MGKQMLLPSLSDTDHGKSQRIQKSSIPMSTSSNENLRKERKNLNTGNALTESYAVNNFKINEVKSQLNAMHELSTVYLSDVKKIRQKTNKERKKYENKFVKRMTNFQRFREILSLLQNSEVREAFRTKTKGAIQLTEEEFAHLDRLSVEINPSINSVPNKTVWRKKLRSSTFKGMELTFGSNKKINGSWTGQDTKRLLERINNCRFFEGESVWINMEIFDRLNKSASPTKATFAAETKSNSNLNNVNVPKCHDQSLSKNSFMKNAKTPTTFRFTLAGSNVQQNNTEAEKKTSKIAKASKRETYMYIKMSDKPDDYYLYFNFYPARFTADIKVPQSLARRPPGIFRCDI